MLVWHADLGTLCESPSDGNPLLLPAGERVRLPLSKALQIHRLKHPIHMSSDLALLELTPAEAPSQAWLPIFFWERSTSSPKRSCPGLLGIHSVLVLII